MNPMKRKQEQISGSVRGSSTVPEANGQNTSTHHERPCKRARTEEDFVTNTLDLTAPGKYLIPVVPSPPLLSARARKRAKVIGEIGSDDKAKGLVRYGLNGLLEHSSDEAKTWVAAVYHNDLRAELIKEAARVGRYDHGRKFGAGPTDITSFLASQKSWGPERKDWPDVLFQIEVDKKTGLPKTVPHWYRNGRLVIDHDNHPLRDFPGLLPVTLSSEAEGWLLEAFTRSDPRVQIKDLRGRMPKDIVVTKKNRIAGNIHQTKPLFTPRTITQRTLRFRGQAGLKARDVRGGSDTINKGLDALIPAEARKQNNTKELGRLLTSEEVKAFKKSNAGKYPQRGRALKSVTSTSSKRKRNEQDVQGEGSKKINKRARGSENAVFLGEGSILMQGSGFGQFTPELSSTAESSPSYLNQGLSTPGDQDYLPLDPALFPQDESAFQEWLFQDSSQPLAAPEDGDKWKDLLNLSPQEAYNLMNASTQESQGWNADVNRTYGPVSNGQPYHPYTNHVGGMADHDRGSTTFSVPGQLHQALEATEEQYYGGAWNQDAHIGIQAGYAQSYHASLASRANYEPIETGPLYPEFGTGTHPGYGPAQQAPAPTRPAAQTHTADETMYPDCNASIPMMYNQVPAAVSKRRNRGYIIEGSPVENTVLRADSSLPAAQPTTRASAQKPRKGKGKVQHQGRDLVDAHSTPPAFEPLINSNQQRPAASAHIPLLSMACNARSNAVYTTYDESSVYYSNTPHHGRDSDGDSIEPVGRDHDEVTGAETGGPAEVNRQSAVAASTVDEPVGSTLAAMEDFLREAEYLRR